jgi:hypothetical protein
MVLSQKSTAASSRSATASCWMMETTTRVVARSSFRISRAAFTWDTCSSHHAAGFLGGPPWGGRTLA